MALLPEIVIVAALGATDSPWRWSPASWAVTVLHHGVCAAGAAFALLERRGET